MTATTLSRPAPSAAAFMLLDREVPQYVEGMAVDQIPVILGELQLFGKQTEDFSEPGVYVYVRDGVVTMNAPGGNFSLNRGETGFFDRTGQRFERLSVVPTFIDRDGFTRHMDFEGYGCSAK